MYLKRRDIEIDPSIPAEVIIEHDNDEKYIIGYITTTGPDDTDVIQKYVLVSMPLDYHADIADDFRLRLKDDEDFEILGGGILTIDRDSKFIKTYGRSGAYGPPPIDLLTHIIKKNFDDWKTEITVTDYIRG